ncbi:hypothetical protein SDC9_189849 [bioreactor metagenome]|uniref:Uncharacterized protein n=1 Tax=bioreactor metagenome TaxID=1076179 RepID=A0A645HUZ1_9ZZZZ
MAETGCVNYIATLVDQVTDGFFAIGVFGNVFKVYGFYTQRFFQSKPALVMRIGIPFIPDRAHIKEANLDVCRGDPLALCVA